MRLALFSILSVGLHAAALAYPITFASRTVDEAIHVTVLPMALEPEASMEDGGGNGAKPAHVRTNRHRERRPALVPCCGDRASPDRVLEESSAAQQRDPVRQPRAIASPEVVSVSDSTAILTAAADAPSDAQASAGLGSPQNETYGAGGEMNAAGNHGVASGFESAGGGGIGAGSGTGFGSGMTLTQARYSNTPRPEYPESARREGREGRVLLRVLVDERGRSKHVEIHSSSGSEALDRAAGEAIRRWRFDPARYGDQPVESWLRVPIEFRLTDAKQH